MAKYAKGESGNPRGRPVVPKDVKEMLKAASADAARLLVQMANDPKIKPELRVECAKTILDRVYGRPTQPIDGNIDGGIVITLAGEAQDHAG